MKSCSECKATYPNDYAICPKDGAPLHETNLWQIGTMVRGRYRIQARLGEGGMAFVYKAHHELLDEFRALKVIKPELASDPEFMSRFKNEAIMARKLNHPNAVRVDDLDIAEDGLPFIAMELVVGDTLKTLVQRTGPLPVSLVLDIATNVCDALDAAHKLGLIHRDIKPENIVLIARREGPPMAKILDFGISRLREETAGSKGLTQTGMVIGTPEYMSPEQSMGKRSHEIDGRSDLYSLGVVMYRMLTGELPFKGETTVEMILHHLRTSPTAPHELKPELAIPENVSAIVMKALEKDRTKRFSTGAEMAAAIKKARGSTTAASHRIDWAALSSAEASFGMEKDAPGSPPPRIVAATSRPAASAYPDPAAPAPERQVYRTSARIGPPRKEFPTRIVVTLVVVAFLLLSALGAWKYFAAGASAKRTGSTPTGTATPGSTKSTEPPAAGGQKSSEVTKNAPASLTPAPASNGKHSKQSKNLSYSDQARIVELNSLAAIYYREGGCAKALPAFQQVLEIDPRDPRAYSAVKKCYSMARRSAKPVFPPITPAPTTVPDNAASPNP